MAFDQCWLKLTLTGTAIKNGTLLRILNSCKDELIELNLTSTHISLCECLPEIVELKKLKYFAAPANDDINASGTVRAVVELIDARLYVLWTARKAIP